MDGPSRVLSPAPAPAGAPPPHPSPGQHRVSMVTATAPAGGVATSDPVQRRQGGPIRTAQTLELTTGATASIYKFFPRTERAEFSVAPGPSLLPEAGTLRLGSRVLSPPLGPTSLDVCTQAPEGSSCPHTPLLPGPRGTMHPHLSLPRPARPSGHFYAITAALEGLPLSPSQVLIPQDGGLMLPWLAAVGEGSPSFGSTQAECVMSV